VPKLTIALPALVTVAGVSLYLGLSVVGEDQRVFLPGETSDGHYQIELVCTACHTSQFTSAADLQQACVGCHAAELARAEDSHPRSKFTDPRNADRVALLDARYCVTCHKEHVPDFTLAIGLTLQRDYCFLCHETVAEERPSHAGLPFDSCANAGCHNFHDNRALYEDFLIAHRDEPAHRPGGRVAPTSGAARRAGPPLAPADHDAPFALAADDANLSEWSRSAHAAQGVNCSSCHVEDATGVWRDSVSHAVCAGCHADQGDGFLAGRHGMRLAQGLDPMRPGLARDAMHPQAADRELGCASCHRAHAFARTRAAVDACVECHDDAHTRGYDGTRHAQLFAAELRGELPAGSGVSCATCHLPRVERAGAVTVQHDQNDNLRPNEKMIRTVCLDCHGLGFAIDALADPDLVARNFNGSPALSVPSIEWAARRAQ
jgi:hypothetical protein